MRVRIHPLRFVARNLAFLAGCGAFSELIRDSPTGQLRRRPRSPLAVPARFSPSSATLHTMSSGSRSIRLALVPLLALAALAPASSADASTAPTIESESVTHLTSTDATLEAQVNPNGQNDWAQFQLVEEPSSYATELLCPELPSPGFDGCVGNHSATALPLEFVPDNAAHPEPFEIVSLDLVSAGVTLKPGTTYHYRLLAAPAVQTEDTIQWEEPTVFGPDQTFTTPAAEAPSIKSESVSNVTATDATLEATIEPRGGRNAFYQFQLVNEPSEYASGILCPEPPWPGFSGCIGTRSATALPIGWICGECEIEPAASPVSLDLAGAGVTLQPGTTYHFRVLAASAVRTEDAIQWEEPTVFGQDQTFTTPQPLKGPPPPDPFGKACAFAAAGCGAGPPNAPARVCRKGRHRRHGHCVSAHHRRHHRRNPR
jgi:hypothetical protein